MINEKSCGAFVLNGKKVLIVQQKKSGNYGFPKGHVEPNETEEETAINTFFPLSTNAPHDFSFIIIIPHFHR